MRIFFVLFLSLLLPCAAQAAVEAPPGQTHIGPNQILRGSFTQTHVKPGGQPPVATSGHFVLAPASGLIWGIEKPFPTATVITPAGMAQELGGIAAIKMPASKMPYMRHVYDMVGHALAGDWNDIAADFNMARSGSPAHWQVVLTPRAGTDNGLHYTSIAVTGAQFVESIVMTQTNGGVDTIAFGAESLSPAPPSPQESVAFTQAAQ